MWVKWAFAIKLKQLSTSDCFEKGYYININYAFFLSIYVFVHSYLKDKLIINEFIHISWWFFKITRPKTTFWIFFKAYHLILKTTRDCCHFLLSTSYKKVIGRLQSEYIWYIHNHPWFNSKHIIFERTLFRVQKTLLMMYVYKYKERTFF